MHNFTFALEGAMRVLVVGLVFGAGLPAVYALGIRALAYGDGGDAEVSHARPAPRRQAPRLPVLRRRRRRGRCSASP